MNQPTTPFTESIWTQECSHLSRCTYLFKHFNIIEKYLRSFCALNSTTPWVFLQYCPNVKDNTIVAMVITEHLFDTLSNTVNELY